MKWFLLFVLVSCASTKSKKLTIISERPTIFSSESLTRYNGKRLIDYIPKTIYSKSIKLCHQTRYDEALETQIKQLKAHMHSASYWNAVGLCHLLKGSFETAHYYFNIGLTKQPKVRIKSSINNNLALIELKRNNPEQAKFYLKKAITLDSALTPKVNLCYLYLSYGMSAQATVLLQSFQSQTDSDDINYLNGLNYLINQQYELAYKHFEKLSIEFSQNMDVSLYKSYTFLKVGKVSEAMSLFDSIKTDQFIKTHRLYTYLEQHFEKIQQS